MSKISKGKLLNSLNIFSIVVLISLPVAFLIAVFVNAAPLNYDPFLRFNRTLPFSDNGNSVMDSMLITAPPEVHLTFPGGYYAQDFARFHSSSIPTLGTPIHSISDGEIVQVNLSESHPLGRFIIIDHSNGYRSRYNHLQLLVFTPADVGRQIVKGQEIGTLGNTGTGISDANLELVLYHNGVEVKGHEGPGTYDGSYARFSHWDANGQPVWEPEQSPVDTFDVPVLTRYSSITQVRETHEDDIPVIDPLDRYLENYGDMFPSGMIAEPINTDLGQFIHKNTDLEVQSGTDYGPLKFERFYNSLDSYTGPNGKGWTNSFNIRLLAHEGNKFSIKFADGRGETFLDSDNNIETYEASYQNLTKESLGTLIREDAEWNHFNFVYTDAERNEYAFYGDSRAKFFGKIKYIKTTENKRINFEYDVNGNLKKVSDEFGNFLQFNFDISNILTSASDSNGNVVTYIYNFDGRLTSVLKANGGLWNYSYDTAGQITEIKDAEGKIVAQNVYDENGRVTEQTDGRGEATTLAYSIERNILGQPTGREKTEIEDNKGNKIMHYHNEHDYLVEEKDQLGNTKKYEYNDKGLISKRTLPNGLEIGFERNALGNITEETRSNGYVSERSYDSNGLLTSATDVSGTINVTYNANRQPSAITNQIGQTIQYQYNAAGQLASEVDPNGNTKTYTYNPKGLFATEQDSGTGATLTYGYDASGNRISITDSAGLTTHIAYDSLNKPQIIFDGAGAVSAYVYDANGNLSTQTDERGFTTSYESDANENITKIVYPDGGVETFEYDENNNKISETDALGNLTKYIYDKANRNTEVEYYDNNNTLLYKLRNKYDSIGNRIESTNPNGHKTKYKYDAIGNLIEVENPQGKKEKYKYDNLGQLVSLTDFENNETKFEYDALGRRTKEIDPLGNETKFEYDGNDNLTKRINALVGEYKYEYNSQNKVVREINELGNIATKSYNQLGQLVADTNFEGETVTFTYAPNNKVHTQANALGHTTTYNYDLVGNLVSSLDPNGNQAIYNYDSMNRRTTQVDAYGNFNQSAFDLNGNLIKFTGEDGTFSTYTYDRFGRKLTEIDPLGNTTNYSYDKNGNLLQVKDRRGNITKFAYDTLDRQTKVTDANNKVDEMKYSANGWLLEVEDKIGNSEKYEYDKLGRQTKIINKNNVSKSFQYDALGRKVKETDFKGATTEYSYNAASNLTLIKDRSNQITTYNYDRQSRVIEILQPLGISSRFIYDDAGRTFREIDALGAATTYVYDNAANVKQIIDANNHITSYNYDALNRRIQTIDPIGAISNGVYDSRGRLVQEIDALGAAKVYEYDPRNNVVRTTTPNGFATAMTYDAEGNILSKTEPNSAVSEYKYDKLNRLIETKLPDGNKTFQNYDVRGRLASHKDAKGFETKYVHDKVDNLMQEADPVGNVTKHQYDSNNNVIKTTNPLGQATQFQYDSSDRLTKAIDPLGSTRLYEYDAAGRAHKITDELGNLTTYVFDLNGKPIQEINALGGVKSYFYDAVGNAITSVDANGNITSFNYNPRNELIAETNALGFVKQFNYDVRGKLANSTEANSGTSQYVYDANGNMIQELDPLGFARNFNFDSNNNLIQETDARGNATSFAYDLRNRLANKTLPGGEQYRYEYDANNNLLKEISPNGGETKNEYDSRNLLVATTNPVNAKQKFEYDALGRIVKEINPSNHNTQFSYDALSRLTKVKDRFGYETKYEYNKLGSLTKEIDAKGNATSYSYDALQRQTKEKNALGNEWKYEYDAIGNQIKRIDANNAATQYSYDQLNRLTTKDYGFADQNVSISYNSVNDIAQVTKQNISQSFDYDLNRRIVSQADSLGRTASYSYDEVGNRRYVTYPDGRRNEFTYNANDNLSSLKLVHDGNLITASDPMELVTTFEYDVNQNLVKQKNPNNSVTNQSYDAANRITQIEHLINSANNSDYSLKYNLEYNQNGNIAKETILSNGSGDYGNLNQNDLVKVVRNYTYDPLERVTSLKESASNNGNINNFTPSFSQNFGYDIVGNRTSVGTMNHRNGSQENLNLKYNAINQLTDDGKYSYNYDRNGNLTNKHGRGTAYGNSYKYEYNIENQLIAVDTKAEDGYSLNYKMQYEYDGLGRRVSKINNNQYAANSLDLPYQGIEKVEYTYDGQTWETLSEHFNRLDAPLASANPEEYFDLHTNFAKYESELLASEDLAETSLDELDPSAGVEETDYEIFPVCVYDNLDGTYFVNWGHENILENAIPLTESFVEKRDLTNPSILIGTQTNAISRILYAGNHTRSFTQTANIGEQLVWKVFTESTTKEATVDVNFVTKCEVYEPTQASSDQEATSIEPLVTSEYESPIGDQMSQVSLEEGTKETENPSNESENLVETVQESIQDQKIQEEPIIITPTEFIDYSLFAHCIAEQPSDRFTVFFGYENNMNGMLKLELNSVNSNTIFAESFFHLDNKLKQGRNVQSFYVQSPQSSIVKWNTSANGNARSIEVTTAIQPDGTIAYQSVTEQGIIDAVEKCSDDFLNQFSWTITPDFVQRINYYHKDQLGSAVGVSKIETLSYNVVTRVINPDPIINHDNYDPNDFEPFGKVKNENPNREQLFPQITGFESWNNKTYSSKEFDIENSSYYYGSRFYDPSAGTWNKLDSYRGEVNDPSSRNRYMFVSNNPVNNMDVYGFACGDGTSIGPCNGPIGPLTVAKGKVQQDIDYSNELYGVADVQKADYVETRNALNTIIPGLQARMNDTWWTQYKAKVVYQDHVVMQGIVGRLEQRGYEWSYAEVASYLGNKTQEKAQDFQIKYGQYVVAKDNYYGTVSERNNLNYLIDEITIYQSDLKKDISFYESKLPTVNEIIDLSKDNNTLNQALEKVNQLSFHRKQVPYVDMYDPYLSSIFNDSIVEYYSATGQDTINIQNNEEFAMKNISYGKSYSGEIKAQIKSIWAYDNSNYDPFPEIKQSIQDMAICMIPYLDTGCDVYGALWGKDIQGKDLEGWERVVSAIAILAPFGGAIISKGEDVVGMVNGSSKVVNKLDDASDLSRLVNKADNIGDATKKADQLKNLGKGNFRTNLNSIDTKPTTMANPQAHHVFPQKYEGQFNAAGINIHDPKYGSWWESAPNVSGNHQSKAFEYNLKWKNFLQNNPTQQEIIDFGKGLTNQYGLKSNF